MAKSVERLEEWCKAHYSLHLPGTIDADVAKRYRSWMFSGDAGLSIPTVGKAFRLLNSVFIAVATQQLLHVTSFYTIPTTTQATDTHTLDIR